MFRRLQQNTVSRCQRSGHRRKRDKDWIIPRRDHAHDARRLRHHVRPCRLQRPVERRWTFLHPIVNVRRRMTQGMYGYKYLRIQHLHPRPAAEIGMDRTRQILLPLKQRRPQAIQILAPFASRRIRIFRVRLTLQIKDWPKVHSVHRTPFRPSSSTSPIGPIKKMRPETVDCREIGTSGKLSLQEVYAPLRRLEKGV